MGLKALIEKYIDDDGLVANIPNPVTVRTGGNQLLETSTLLILLRLSGELGDSDVYKYFRTVRNCEVEPGLYDKNPPYNSNRRLDDITHDEIIGISMASSLLKLPFSQEITSYGSRKGWVFSNNGTQYFTAHAKPWHRAAYLIAAGETPDSWSFVTLLLALLLGALICNGDFSGKRLELIMLEALSKKNGLIDLIYTFWRWRVTKQYGSIKRIFIAYHGENHPFASEDFVANYYNRVKGS